MKPPAALAGLPALLERLQALPPVRFAQRYGEDHLPDWAAAVAYHGFFSLFPILLGLWTGIGLVLQDESRMLAVTNALLALLPQDVGPQLLSVLQSARLHTGWYGLVSIVGLIYSGSALFGCLEAALCGLYRVPQRDFLWQKVMATGMVVLFALLLVFSVVAASLAEGARALASRAAEDWLPGPLWSDGAVALGNVLNLLGWMLPTCWAFLFFLAIYTIVPNRRQAPTEVWPGALVAAGLFLAITQVFPLYLRYLVGFNQYGAVFSLTLLLLTWFLFLAHAILIGAALNAYRVYRPDPEATGAPDPLAPTPATAAGEPPPLAPEPAPDQAAPSSQSSPTSTGARAPERRQPPVPSPHARGEG